MVNRYGAIFEALRQHSGVSNVDIEEADLTREKSP